MTERHEIVSESASMHAAYNKMNVSSSIASLTTNKIPISECGLLVLLWLQFSKKKWHHFGFMEAIIFPFEGFMILCFREHANILHHSTRQSRRVSKYQSDKNTL